MKEAVYFRRDQLRISNARVVLSSKTIAVRAVVGFDTDLVKPHVWPAIALIVVGIAVEIGMQTVSRDAAGFGGLLLLVGIIWLWRQKAIHHVTITDVAGRSFTWTTTDPAAFSGAVDALNKAIVLAAPGPPPDQKEATD